MVVSLRSKWAAGKAVPVGLAVGGRIPLQFSFCHFSSLTFSKKTGAGRNRRATHPPAHFQRYLLGRSQLAVFPRCSLGPYQSQIWALRSRLEKQPTDLRRHHHYLRDAALANPCQRAYVIFMGMFTDLMVKIFRHATAAPASAVPPSPPSTTIESATAPTPTTPAASAVSSVPSSAPFRSVDVTAILDDLAAKNSEKLDWRKSIVDLMKLVDMDSSLSARKELAIELHYSGNENDSAAMNEWLHKEVITKLAENGGKIPQELLS
jgi:hypothetical protein